MIGLRTLVIWAEPSVMITVNLRCRHCQSEHIVRNGHTMKGKQKFLCRTCGRQSREGPEANAYHTERRQEILATYREGSSLRGVSRIFGVSRNTVSLWLKQAEAESSGPQESGRHSTTKNMTPRNYNPRSSGSTEM
jgi:transposase-like protein